MEPGEFLGGVVVIVAVLAVLVATSWATYKRRWRKAGTWGALLVCLLLYLAFNAMKIADLAEWHQRCDRTSRMIDATARQVRAYMRDHHVAPPSLMAATRGKGPTIDAWGRELTYSVDKDGVVTLGAYGTDGKGLNPYLTFRFRTRHADGSLIVGDGPIDWIGRAPYWRASAKPAGK
ncbi:MAG: hypothetical protein ACLQLG_07800 [Thermoguttaceae bacterium]